MIPRATYRLQFSKEFGFTKAAALSTYLHDLGISHLYASPWLMARSGSTHGYDVIDPGAVNSELGGEAGFSQLTTALRGNGLGHILDFIPNHMGIGGADNALWLDVLEWGLGSAYSEWFDIDWQPVRGDIRDKLLVPFLGNQYGVELEKGELKIVLDDAAGSFAVWAYGIHKLPVCPVHYGQLLGHDHPALERLADAFSHLPPRHKSPGAAEQLKLELVRILREDDSVRPVIEATLSRFSGVPGDWDTWRDLDALIKLQHWRPAHFRVASDDINYRRFFNVNELAGLRMENPAVFEYAHRFVLELLRSGDLDGLRIDHIDGLFDPKQYLQRLREATDGALGSRTYLVVEKILAHHEGLREEWPVEGTTGYEFGAQVLGVLIDPAGEEALSRVYRDFTAREFSAEMRAFPEMVRECKLRIMENEMAGELDGLAREAVSIAHQNPHTTDFTQKVLQRALKEIVACFPVYRTYVDSSGEPTADDRRDLQWAVEQARRWEMDLDPSVFDFVHQLLTGDMVASANSGFSRHSVLRFAMKFQQYSVPVMAKGLEDTAFYRYHRLLALNEVGARPDQFGLPLSGLHRANASRQKLWPHTLLETSTHDSKLGEDARARLAVLSEMPDEWERQVKAWTRILRAGLGGAEGDAPPDRNDEYRFYQLLLATWPAELTLPNELDAGLLSGYAERIKAGMLKSIREAKIHTSWIAHNVAYENAATTFIDRALDPEQSKTFLTVFRPFQERVARLGVRNSLFQLVIKLTSPGVPDIYQGCELWDLNMVDPDNRRMVDYASRQRLLSEVVKDAAGCTCQKSAARLHIWHDGTIKLHVLTSLLRFRREHTSLFDEGQYMPLPATGLRTDSIFAFQRHTDSEQVLVVAARFPAANQGTDSFNETWVALPNADVPCVWRDLLTNQRVFYTPNGLDMSLVLRDLPVAVLVPVE